MKAELAFFHIYGYSLGKKCFEFKSSVEMFRGMF